MRVLPRSIFGRLLALALLATAAALAVAGVAIGGVLERFVTHTLDDRLTDKLSALSGAVRKDGSLDPAYLARFDTLSARDADWRVEAPGGTVGSAMIDGQWKTSFGEDQRIGPIERYVRRGPRHGPGEASLPPDGRLAAQPFDGRLRDGERVHGLWQNVPTDRGPARVAVAVSRDVIDRPLREALVPLALSLAALAVALAVAAAVQLRVGLRPLGDLQRSLAAVRAGRLARVPVDQPRELQPFATELNALLDQNEAGLARARGHVANLAHGLKTPLAALIVRLEEPGRDPDGALRALAEGAAARVRHHLGRARAAAPGAGARARVALAPVVDDLLAVLARVHAERAIAAEANLAGLAVAADAEDVAEMLGNLLDNAWRHAATRVRVTATPLDGAVAVTIEDDGRGLSTAALAEALLPGRRLDERGDGHGFGLPIARELAELAGGGLALARSATLGGVAATLTLPGTT
ncbi:sensor histidine kinase [Sphingomonas sp.]|uniref:sensor histidine kinase n=1 Tax=Sphingomonas sp. TaxID=28214 RepID=UPI003AFFFECE